MRAPFKITCYEEGNTRKQSSKSFPTLREASRYIQDRWQGPEYMDGADQFHTDYSSYILAGFTLRNIGTIGFDAQAQCRTYCFTAIHNLGSDRESMRFFSLIQLEAMITAIHCRMCQLHQGGRECDADEQSQSAVLAKLDSEFKLEIQRRQG